MPKFRKKPLIITAEQLTEDHVPSGVEYTYDSKEGKRRNFRIRTLEGTMAASVGDWIITGINGEKYPCKPDIFEKSYERLEAD